LSPETQTIAALIVAVLAGLGWVRNPSPGKTGVWAEILKAIGKIGHKPTYLERIEVCEKIITEQHAMITAIKAEAEAEMQRIEEQLTAIREVL
jgi:hypothetical protein